MLGKNSFTGTILEDSAVTQSPQWLSSPQVQTASAQRARLPHPAPPGSVNKGIVSNLHFQMTAMGETKRNPQQLASLSFLKIMILGKISLRLFVCLGFVWFCFEVGQLNTD